MEEYGRRGDYHNKTPLRWDGTLGQAKTKLKPRLLLAMLIADDG
jgi:hypothetical protein